MRSTRVALALLIVLMAASLLSVMGTLPGGWHGPLFAGLGVALAANMLACTLDQGRRTFSRWGRPEDFAPQRKVELDLPQGGDGPVEARLIPAVAATLQRRGYRVHTVDVGAGVRARGDRPVVVGTKQRLAAWSPVVFHAALFLVIVGGVVSVLFRFWGSFGLFEGQTFTPRTGAFVVSRPGPFRGTPDFGFDVRLDRVNVLTRPDGRLYDFRAAVTILREGVEVRSGEVGGSSAVTYGGATLRPKTFGYAPVFLFRPAPGAPPLRFTVTLQTSLHRPEDPDYREDFRLPWTGHRFSVEFSPDVTGQSLNNGKVVPRRTSQRLKRPAIHVVLWEKGERLYEGNLLPGRTADFGGRQLTFLGVEQWYGFALSSDPGVPVLWVAFGLASLALAALYGLVPRRVGLWFDENLGRPYLGGRADRFPALLESELQEIAGEVKGRIAANQPL